MVKRVHERVLQTVGLVVALGALGAVAGDDPSNFSPSQFPGEVYQMDPQGLYAIVNVENLPASNHRNWKAEDRTTRPEYGRNHVGDHFFTYQGPKYVGVHPDTDHSRQGDKDSWLVFKFMVPQGQGGYYKMLVRKSHLLHDGDNDCWVGYIGMPKSVVIGRYGWGARNYFTWGNTNMEDNRKGFQLSEGLNAVYVGGRSQGFAVCRIAVYKASGGDESAAENTATPESPVVGATSTVDFVPRSGLSAAPGVARVFDLSGRNIGILTGAGTQSMRAASNRVLIRRSNRSAQPLMLRR